MKLSVSLPATDVSFLDSYCRERQLPSRSAAFQEAVGALRRQDLEAAYATAWEDWRQEAPAWETTTADGLVPTVNGPEAP